MWLGAPVFPVDPIDGIHFKVGAHGRAESWKNGLFANLRKQSKALQLIFDRILQLRE